MNDAILVPQFIGSCHLLDYDRLFIWMGRRVDAVAALMIASIGSVLLGVARFVSIAHQTVWSAQNLLYCCFRVNLPEAHSTIQHGLSSPQAAA